MNARESKWMMLIEKKNGSITTYHLPIGKEKNERASERTMCVWKNIEIGITEKANFVKPKDGTK